MKIKVIFLIVVLWSMFVNPVLGQLISSDSTSVQNIKLSLNQQLTGCLRPLRNILSLDSGIGMVSHRK
jgi:hypothetical protein